MSVVFTIITQFNLAKINIYTVICWLQDEMYPCASQAPSSR